jgi:hypothetical protein
MIRDCRFRTMFAVLAGLVVVACLPVAAAAQATYLVNTGAGSTSSIGAPALFASGSTTCSPQPGCADDFQFLAFQFTLTQAATLEAIELWVVGGNSGGAMDVKIRENTAAGLPAATAPPLRSPGSIFSKRYGGLPSFAGARWVAFGSYDAVLAAGTYWITFEPVHGTNLNYSMGGNAPSPLPKYAFYAEGNPGYVALTPATNSNHRLGLRLTGTTFPGAGFGTATRTILKGSTFGGAYDYDFIRAGTRDFTPIGTGGPALTSSYIFVTPGGYVHGRGSLTQNGLTAGAYAVTDGGCLPASLCSASVTGAGRGVAYRTFVNLSDAPRTFRVNAILDGRLSRAGKHAFAGVYVFDSAPFNALVGTGGSIAAELLLQRDDLAKLAGGANLSLATLFPPDALLTSAEQFVDAPFDSLIEVPLTTAPVTIAPGASVTVLFDVAVYAPGGGAVNFAETLRPAPHLITDDSGLPVHEIVAVGPSAATPPPAAAIVLGPSGGSSGAGTLHGVTAAVTGAGAAPVPGALVTFTVTSGPNSGLTAQVPADGDGEATFTYAGTVPGTDTIKATVSALDSNTVSHAWTAGALDAIVITPGSATIPAGGSQAYTAEAFDAWHNSLGNVTASTLFSIAPDGACLGATCTATVTGTHTVSGTYAGKTAQASLEVTGGGGGGGFSFTGFFAPVDNPPVVNVAKAGSTVPLKFSLGGYHGLDVLAPGAPSSRQVTCEAGVPSDVVTETGSPGASGLSYDAEAGRYVYLWKTSKAWANTCRELVLTLADGSSHSATFRFAK